MDNTSGLSEEVKKNLAKGFKDRVKSYHEKLKEAVGPDLAAAIDRIRIAMCSPHRAEIKRQQTKISSLRQEIARRERRILDEKGEIFTIENDLTRYVSWRNANPTADDREWQRANRNKRYVSKKKANLAYRRERASKVDSKSVEMQLAAMNNKALDMMVDAGGISKAVARYCKRNMLPVHIALQVQQKYGHLEYDEIVRRRGVE